MAGRIMEKEDLGGKFVIAVEDFSGVWNSIKKFLEAKTSLDNITLRNKFGKPIQVTGLKFSYELSTDPSLSRLKPHAQNPVAWFRNPYAHVLVVSCEDLPEYRSDVRPQLRAFMDREKDPMQTVLGTTEWVVLYVRPLKLDSQARGPKRVFEKLQDDFGSKRKDRFVRLDIPAGSLGLDPGRVHCEGLRELEAILKTGVSASFEAKQAAYDEEVRRLMSVRMEPGWSFPTLFLVKDSLALMLDAAGLLDDALREYYELEACYLEALDTGGVVMVGEFGGSGPGDDVASLLNSSWKDTRRAILNYGSVTQFKFRQFLFARQARLLLLLGRPMELADRALGFIQNFSGLLEESLESGHLPESLREVWVFSACIAVAGVSHEAVSATSQERAGGAVQKRPQQSQGASPAPGGTSKRSPQLTVQVDGLRDDDDAEPGSGPAFAEDWKLGLELPKGAWRPHAAAEEGPGKPGPLPPGHREFFCTLGHLLSSARQHLLKLGEAVGLEVCLRQSRFGGCSVAAGYPSAQQHRGPPSSRGTQGPSRQVAGSAPASPQQKSSTPQRQRPDQQLQQQQGPLRSESMPLSAVKAAQAAAAAPPTPSTPGLLGLKARLPWSSSSNPDPPSIKSNGNSNPRLNLADKFDSESAGSSESSMSSISASAAVAPLGETRSKAPPLAIGANADAVVAAAAAAEQTAQGAAKEKGAEERQEGATHAEQEVAVRHNGKMPWLSEWRLKKALKDRDLFEDLFKQLSIAAAHCYRVSGRHRNATMIEADVAALLLDSRRPQAASDLFQRHVKMLEAEGWHAVLAQVLPEVVSSKELLHDAAAGHWKAKILSLPEALLPHVDRSDLQLSLEAVCREAAARPHGTPRSALFPKGTISGLDCAGALLVCPSSGHQQGPSCVGDVVVLEVELWSALPNSIVLEDVVLTLVIRSDGPSGHEGEFRCSLLQCGGPGHNAAEAAPGRNALRFSAQPVQAGRYCLKHLTARVGSLSVHVPMAPTAPASVAAWEPRLSGGGSAAAAKHEMLRMPRLASTSRGAFCGAAGDPLSGQGSTGAARVQDGEVIAEQPLFLVKDSQSRLGVSAPALPGSLLAGQTQWLGIRLEPRRDSLLDASVQIWTRQQHNAESGTSATTTLPGSSSQALVVPLLLSDDEASEKQQQQQEEEGEEGAAEEGAGGVPEPMWVRVEDGCLRLPEWAGSRPSIVWFRAAVGPISGAPQVVRMSSGIEGPSRFDASRRMLSLPPVPNPSTSGDPASIARQISARAASSLHTAAAIEAEEQECDAHTEVEVDVRYRSGCNRSHNCILRLPVSNPCRVDFTAHRLDGGRIALEVSLTSCLPQPLTVRGCRLKPQVGLLLERDLMAACGALPATVLPRASVSFMYFVRQTRVSGGPSEGDVAAAATCFEVDYEVVATDKGSEGAKEEEEESAATPPSLRDLAGLEAPPGSWIVPPGSRDGGGGAQGTGAELVTLQRCFTIDMGIKEATPDMVIEVQALGPFTAVQGIAIHFCWRLLRGGAQRQHPTALVKQQQQQQQQRDMSNKAEGACGCEGPAGSTAEDSDEDCGDEAIEYEIAAAGDMWRAGVPRRRGRIWLTRRPGAAATIEASWVPLLQGTLPLPELQLRGVAWREARADQDNNGGAGAGALPDGLEVLEDGGGASVCNTPTHCVVHPAAATGAIGPGSSGIAAAPSGFLTAHPPGGLVAAPLVTSSLGTEAGGDSIIRSKSLGPPANQGTKAGLRPPALF